MQDEVETSPHPIFLSSVGVIVADELMDDPILWPACVRAIDAFVKEPRPYLHFIILELHPMCARVAESLRTGTPCDVRVRDAQVMVRQRQPVALPENDSRRVIAMDSHLVRETNAVMILHTYEYSRDPRFFVALSVAEKNHKSVYGLNFTGPHDTDLCLVERSEERLQSEIRKIMTDWSVESIPREAYDEPE